jgi:hypothetical protein
MAELPRADKPPMPTPDHATDDFREMEALFVTIDELLKASGLALLHARALAFIEQA